MKKRAKVEVKTEPGESDGALDTEYHKPSELANKQNKKKAMADLLSKRRDKKHGAETRNQCYYYSRAGIDNTIDR